MKSLYSVEYIKLICKRFNFSLSKRYGQNFLLDPNAVSKIAEASEATKEDLVIEVGPGFGVLTRELASRAKEVIACDIDKRLERILEETLSTLGNTQVIIEDILKLNVDQLVGDRGFKDFILVGNLPYYITTPIIFQMLEYETRVKKAVFMMQKEVGDRILASHGTKNYGIISPILNYYYDVEKVTNVSSNVFYPRPKVDSVVLSFKPRQRELNIEEEEMFKKLVKGSFANRRKTIINSLSSSLDFDKEYIKETLLRVGIDPKRRGETLSIDEFLSLTKEVSRSIERQ